MQVQTIIDALERIAPHALQEEWDNSGLQVGRLSADCRGGMVVALDATEAVVDFAIAQGVGVIVTHHPLLFKGLQTIDTDQATGRVVEKLIKSDTTLYALHTPADSTLGGLNDQLAQTLGLVECRPLEPSSIDPRCGLGRIGKTKQPIDIKEFIAKTADALGLKQSIAYACPQGRERIERVAVCSGSGSSMIDAAAQAGVDLLVCGDVRHHDFQHALERNLAIVDATHYATEIGFVNLVDKWVKNNVTEIQKKIVTFAVHSYLDNFISHYTR